MYFRLFFVLICVGVFCSAECRTRKNISLNSQDIRVIKRLSRYLEDDNKKNKKSKKERLAMQRKRAIEVRTMRKKKKIERQIHQQMKKTTKEQKAKREEVLRKERAVENRRRKKISGWRHYFDRRKAAASLMRAIKDTDSKNKVHVSQLQSEIRDFSKERLNGNIEKYPELKGFLRLKS